MTYPEIERLWQWVISRPMDETFTAPEAVDGSGVRTGSSSTYHALIALRAWAAADLVREVSRRGANPIVWASNYVEALD